MRIKTVFLAVAALVVAGSSSAGAAEVSIVSGSVALATWHQASADGCVVTSGEIAVVQTVSGGDLEPGLYVTAMRENSCTGEGLGGWAGLADGAFVVVPLLWGHYSGTAVIDSYSGAEPLTIALDLSWTGHGKITHQRDVYHDGSTISFQFEASRAATTRGTFRINGAAATVDSATLGAQASGQIVR